jgi:hypothetical protein
VNKFRSKLLVSFLLCMTLPAGLGVIVFGHQNEHRQIDDALHQLDTGHLFLQESYQQTREFFNFAQRNTNFFETGESAYLDSRARTLEKARATLAPVYDSSDPALLKKLEQQECIVLQRGKILVGSKAMPGTNEGS